MTRSYVQTEEYVRARHDHWCRHLDGFCRSLGVGTGEWPTAVFPRIVRGRRLRRWGGWYYQSVCYYPIGMAVVGGDAYDATVAHEVCHHYQRKVMPQSASHGETWQMLYRVVCGFKESRAHRYDVSKAARVAELIAAQEQFAA